MREKQASLRHLTVSAALTLTLLAAVAACGAEPVSPLPIEALGPSAPATSPATSPTTQVPSPRVTTRGPTASPDVIRSPACLGAVVYTLEAEEELALIKSICLAVGGILRVEGTGPGTVSADPPDKVSQFYEAGIVEVRFLSPGTITVTIDRDEQTLHHRGSGQVASHGDPSARGVGRMSAAHANPGEQGVDEVRSTPSWRRDLYVHQAGTGGSDRGSLDDHSAYRWRTR